VSAGIKVAIVHGGGPQANALSQRLGLETKQVAGQRVTDAETLQVMKQALGEVGVDVASALRIARVTGLATSGVSGGLVEATRRPPVQRGDEVVDYGLVGDITGINVTLFERLAKAGIVPIVSCLAGDAFGHVYNVNADTVATRLASRLGAARLLLVSNVPGVLKDRSDPTSRIARLTPKEARQAIADGTVQGGMIPKVEESVTMLSKGIGAIHIVGISPPTALLEEAMAPGSHGTVFIPD
jgi:acetylglutamate kinase